MTGGREVWSYERKRRSGYDGTRWHFVSHSTLESGVPYRERPSELYFRNDDRTEFGLLRFERRKDNPYRNYEAMVTKIMNDADFRRSLLDPNTAKFWNKNWK